MIKGEPTIGPLPDLGPTGPTPSTSDPIEVKPEPEIL